MKEGPKRVDNGRGTPDVTNRINFNVEYMRRTMRSGELDEKEN